MNEYVEAWTENDLNNGFTYQWNPDDGKSPMLKITKSSLGTYGFCRGSYVMNYDPFGNGKIKGPPTEAMLRGTEVHNAQEAFWDLVDTEEMMEHIDDPNKLVKSFMALYPETNDETTSSLYKGMASWSAERFIDCVKDGTLEFFKPVGNEVRLNAKFDVNGVQVHLQGIIDRLFIHEGSYVPLELKTGVWKDSKATHMRKEMAFYKMLLDNATDEEKIAEGLDPNMEFGYWGWFFPASNYIFLEPVKARTEQSVLNSMQKLVDSYMTKEFPFDDFYKKCRKCGLFSVCEKGEGGITYDW
ncbi:MAG: hypothetical protein CL605_02155 [Altibacter sp.]|uniref:PD-(D/E)XK nuclease family protein n=1 Tax=Altibacter sp. TaxID=2024823 RepID=UPI000C8D5735|nr:PD-(D/E)XK nuclease family protein [Altibacter sp.]MAP53685.1 hypothetical protein [Altibacter sp.]